MSDLPAPKWLELGCGRNKAEGYFGVDRADLPGVDLVHDLECHPWPIAEGCAERIGCYQTLEHIGDLLGFMADLWRVCCAEPQAWVEITVPYHAAPTAWGDPTHVRAFTEDTFRYFEPGFVERFGDYGIAPHYFSIVDQAFKPSANLWVLLRPIKTEAQLATHQEQYWWRDRRAAMLG